MAIHHKYVILGVTEQDPINISDAINGTPDTWELLTMAVLPISKQLILVFKWVGPLEKLEFTETQYNALPPSDGVVESLLKKIVRAKRQEFLADAVKKGIIFERQAQLLWELHEDRDAKMEAVEATRAAESFDG